MSLEDLLFTDVSNLLKQLTVNIVYSDCGLNIVSTVYNVDRCDHLPKNRNINLLKQPTTHFMDVIYQCK